MAVCAILAGTLVYLADFGKDEGGAEVPLNDSVADADTVPLHVVPRRVVNQISTPAENPEKGKDTVGRLPEGTNSDPGQSSTNTDSVYAGAEVDVPPSFPGGETALLKCVSSRLIYPSIAVEQEIQGVVILRFVVLEDGSVGDVVVQKSLDLECDKAAVKAVQSLPKFVPGKRQGKPVKTWFTCPIRFVLGMPI